jgi:flagellar L-ring protein precursor FlgH
MLMVATAGPSMADSLWQRRDPAVGYITQDNRARKIGDLLTVVINENTNVDNKDKREMEKSTTTSNVFNFGGKTASDGASRSASASTNFSNDSTREFEAKADYKSDRRFLDRMTVVVVDVLPNNILVVEGYRQRIISGESRTLRMRGLIRIIDVNANNTVPSSMIGNFQVEVIGRGYESAYTNPGWFGQIMNQIWPF